MLTLEDQRRGRQSLPGRVHIRAEPVPIQWNRSLSVFAKEGFLQAVGDEYGWLGGIDEVGVARCILPYTVVRKGPFRLVRFHVETMPCGRGLDVAEETLFLNSVVDHFRANGADVIIPASTNTLFRTYPDGADAAPYSSYVNDLTLPEETLWSHLNAVYRKKIRHAQKNGIRILTGTRHLDSAYRIICDTLKRSAMRFRSYSSFRRLMEGLGEDVEIFVAERQGTIEGCTIFPFSEHSAYSLYGGRLSTADAGSMNLLNWEAMVRFKRAGTKRFDFMGARVAPTPGSKQEGIMTFKQRFGGQLLHGFMWKFPLRRFGACVYAAGVRLLRGGDVVDAERHKLHLLQSDQPA